MKPCRQIWMMKGVLLLAAILFCCMGLVAQPRLTHAFPFNGQGKILLKWNKVAGALRYDYRKKTAGGAYGAWTSVNLDTSLMDAGLAADVMYSYQVRNMNADSTLSPASNEKSNALQRVWPIRKKSDGTTNSVEILHGYGQPFQYGATNKYLHEGVDMHGESSVDNEVVRAPIGGVYAGSGGSAHNIAVFVLAFFNGDSLYYQFNHVSGVNANLVQGETIAPGDSMAVIQSGAAATWNTLKNHTHCHVWKDGSTTATFFATTRNPYLLFDKDEFRDPQGKEPELMDTNGDGEAVRYRKTPNREDYFENNIVHNGVDIVAEVVDKQSSDAPWQNPKLVGYYIQRLEKGAWKDAVRSPANPFILMDHANWYNSHGDSPNDKFIKSIIDYRDTVRSKPPATPNDYFFDNGDASARWNQYFTYIVTNTKGNDAKEASVDSMQHFATDARKTVAEDNGYKAGYETARCIEEAKFKDGTYQVAIRMRDWVKLPADATRLFKIDNFRPFVKKVDIKSGKLDFKGEWKWDEAAGTLKYEDNKDTARACGKVSIKVYTSEPMKQVNLEVPSLFFAKINNTPVANTDGMEWEFEIGEDKMKDKPEGPHQVLITGKDSADTQLQGFLSTNNVPAAGIERRNIEGKWVPNNPPLKDKVFKFKILSLKDKMSVATEDASACNKNDGKATMTVADQTEELEYTVDNRSWQAGNTFKDLAIGEHEAKARVKGTTCESIKKFTIKESNPLQVSVSGYGTIQICDNANPPTVTLNASASGGSGKYQFSWPGATLVVTGSGTYSVTVTDTVTGCKETKSGEVIFVPIVCSRDPNDIIGPEGFGEGKMVSKFFAQPYMIRFENDPDFATAPAQVVKITHRVDTTVNIFTLRLGDFGFGSFNFQVPANRTFYSARLDVMDSLGVVVDVSAGIDVDKKEAFWIFESKDPATGLAPSAAHLGFLPVNDSTAKGEGYVTFTIKAANFTVTGDTINALASIIFDINAPLATPAIFNTIDAVEPNSKMDPVADRLDSARIRLSWTGNDDTGGSGVQFYDLYVSENGAPYALHLQRITDTTTIFTGAIGNTYSFFTLATDNTGNQEKLKTKGEVSVKLFGSLVNLPVVWLTFQGVLRHNHVHLHWATASEQNSSNYLVERSFDGRHFTAIGSVAAAGNAHVTSNYFYIDSNVRVHNRNVLYYRLRQQNLDLSYTYSPVIEVAVDPAGDAIVRAYPNPFGQHITLHIINVTGTDEKDHVALFNLAGRVLYQRTLGRRLANTVLLGDLPPLAAGVYLLKVTLNRQAFTIKMVRQ